MAEAAAAVVAAVAATLVLFFYLAVAAVVPVALRTLRTLHAATAAANRPLDPSKPSRTANDGADAEDDSDERAPLLGATPSALSGQARPNGRPASVATATSVGDDGVDADREGKNSADGAANWEIADDGDAGDAAHTTGATVVLPGQRPWLFVSTLRLATAALPAVGFVAVLQLCASAALAYAAASTRSPDGADAFEWFTWLAGLQLAAAAATLLVSTRAASLAEASRETATLAGETTAVVRAELDKRFYRGVLLHVAVYYAFVCSGWTVAAASAAAPAAEQGRTSRFFFADFVAHAVLSAILAAGAVSTYALIPLSKLRRKAVDGLTPSMEPEASFFSTLSLGWFDPVMAFGYANTMSLSDLWNVAPEEQIERNLATYYALRDSMPGRSLLYLLFTLCRRAALYQSFLVVLSTVLFFAGPFFLNRILDYLTNPRSLPPWTPYSYIFGLFVSVLSRFALDAQTTLVGKKIGMRARNVLSGLIYRKSLRRTTEVDVNSNEAGASVGKIVSLMSVDAQSVGQWAGSMYLPVITFINVILCIAALWYVLGWAAITGVVLMVILLGSGVPLAGLLRTKFYALKNSRDRRVNAMNELLQGIKIIKLFAWEEQFEKKIDGLREEELKNMFDAFFAASMTRVLWFSAPILTTLVTLASYTVVAGKELDPTIAFTSLALFNLLRGPMQMFPDTLVSLLDTWVSFQRIDNFLKEDELEEFTNSSSNMIKGFNPSTRLGFESASFRWTTKKKPPPIDRSSVISGLFSAIPFFSKKKANTTSLNPPDQDQEDQASNTFNLIDVDLWFPPKKLTVVVGATGSGKSSLVMALLGEMRRTHGRRSCPTDAPVAESFAAYSPGVAYVSQVAWLANATIRENILFGLKFDADRYAKVIAACALEKDLENLDGGDQTEVGEKGINLSGGQKQRLALARAVYSSSPWVVLDDPLS
ncbi:hypothetical protein HK405_007953, partial [Cladochytrium tenue]